MSGNGDGLKSKESLEFRLCYCKRRWRTEDFRNKQTRKHCGKQQKHDQQQQKKQQQNGGWLDNTMWRYEASQEGAGASVYMFHLPVRGKLRFL